MLVFLCHSIALPRTDRIDEDTLTASRGKKDDSENVFDSSDDVLEGIC